MTRRTDGLKRDILQYLNKHPTATSEQLRLAFIDVKMEMLTKVLLELAKET